MSPQRKLLDDCFLHDGRRLRHTEALQILQARISPVARSANRPLATACNAILAQSVTARSPVPAHTNSAVDGYAFAWTDYDAGHGATLTVAGRAAAGADLSTAIGTGQAARIFTGAVMPPGCDTVVMQEDVTPAEEPSGRRRVSIPGGLKRGANVRMAGEDVAAGLELFTSGHRLRPQDLAALASIGCAEPLCYEPLSVAIVSTGNEVVSPGTAPLALGQVYDANAPMLASLVASAGASPTSLGILPDDPEVVRRVLSDAARQHHVILTSGGASLGDEDHTVAALDALGRRHLWQLAIKPGRPMMFGQIGDCIVVGLPGNPVAVFVCFLLYVWPMLRRLSGGAWPEPLRLMLPAAFDFKGRKTGRREFWRGMLTERNGLLAVDKFERDGSGLISGLRAAGGLIDIPEETGDVKKGDPVAFIPLTEYGILPA